MPTTWQGTGRPDRRRRKQIRQDQRRLVQPESNWLDQVLALAKLLHWRPYHTWLSIHSASGFPDLVLVRPPRVVFAELKRDDVPELDAAQELWAADLLACPGVEYYLWRPRDAQTVAAILQGGQGV